MEPRVAAKYVGAGLAAIGTGAAGIGVGTLFGQFLNGALRNPSAVEGQFGRLIFGFAVTEALGIFALLIAFLLLFALLSDTNDGDVKRTPNTPARGKNLNSRRSTRRRFAFQLHLVRDLLWLRFTSSSSRLAIPRIGGIVEARRQPRRGRSGRGQPGSRTSPTRRWKSYEKSLADARGRAQALANETRDKLNANAEQARRKLETELNARLAKAEETIATTKTAAMANVQGIAIDTASSHRPAADRYGAIRQRGRKPRSPTC